MCVHLSSEVRAPMTVDREQALVGFPATFSYSEARRRGLGDRRLYALRDSGVLEQLGRGLYRRTDLAFAVDPDLLEIAHRSSRATLCLTTALARHGLTDTIPASIDVALPRGDRHPRTRAPVSWHAFTAATFDVGRADFDLGDGARIGLYGPERCVIDAFRLRHQEGADVAHEALRRWLRRRGAQPARLLMMARAFPKAEPALRGALEVLL